MEDISKMSTADILAEFNVLTGSAVKRFASRADGERRLAKARADFEPVPDVSPTDAKMSIAEAVEPMAPWGDDQDDESPASEAPPASENAAAPVTSSNAEGVARSWQDPAVRAARSARHGVEVDGVAYNSTRSAFRALNLPDNKHVSFRKQLKAAGELEFSGHTFKIVERPHHQTDK